MFIYTLKDIIYMVILGGMALCAAVIFAFWCFIMARNYLQKRFGKTKR